MIPILHVNMGMYGKQERERERELESLVRANY